MLKADPGKLGLETLLAEITKLKRIRAVGLPADLFTDVAERRIARWRARAAAQFPSTLQRDHTPQVMLTLLAVLCWCRLTEVTDSLVELFVDLMRVINTRAEKRVLKEQTAEFRRVADKEGVLFKVAGVSPARPEDTVREVVFPAVGGEQTLRDLVAEAKATEARRKARYRTVITGSYGGHYRQMLPKLLDALEFRCNNTAHRPVLDAVEVLDRHKERDGRSTHYERAERLPVDGVVKSEWRPYLYDERGRIERISYELCVLCVLWALRRGEIWVVGARRWRNSETHLPANFDLHHDVHYDAIAQPVDPTEFVTALRTRLETSLGRFAKALAAKTAGVSIGTRKNQVWITVSKAEKQVVPPNLDAIKAEVTRRWGVVSLLDLLKEADWLLHGGDPGTPQTC